MNSELILVPRFTLVSTVYNEVKRLDRSIQDIEKQSVKPSEIIITDAGSKDGTYERLHEWSRSSSLNIKILYEPGCNVAKGRNLAISESTSDLIISTDFGCGYHTDWLKTLTEPFQNRNILVTGGSYTVSEGEITSLPARANYLLTGGYRIVLDNDFIPSSRSIAYYKSVWEKIEGYPEWLTLAADDLVFGLKLKALGYSIHLIREPYVFWGRHETRKGYLKEAFNYGLGDGEANLNKRNALSNLIETLLRWTMYITVFFLTISISSGILPGIKLLFILLLFVPGLRSWFRVFKSWRNFHSRKYNFIVFLYSLRLLDESRLKYLTGYIKGYFFSSKVIKSEARKLAGKIK